MSGSKVLSFPDRNLPVTLVEKLRVEDDRRLLRCAGAGSVLGAAFAGWALTIQIMLPPPLVYEPRPPTDHDHGFYRAVPPQDYHGKIKDHRVAKHTAPPGQARHTSPKPKTAHVAKATGWLGQSILTSRSDRLDIRAADLLPSMLKHIDAEKLDELPILKRTSASPIAGRRGRVSHEFNLEYVEDGTGCAGADCGGTLLPDLPAPTSLKTHGTVSAPVRLSSMDFSQENNARSSAAILAVIRAHGPGLRHVYNAFLKRAPGLRGKLSLAFSIAPSGDVLELSIVSSTTASPDFDAEVGRQVKTWRFDPVKAPGNDHVTVPFTFSE
jgi:TonB family protein